MTLGVIMAALGYKGVRGRNLYFYTRKTGHISTGRTIVEHHDFGYHNGSTRS